MSGRRGLTLVELVVGMAVMAILTVAFAGFLRGVNQATTSAQKQAEGQEEVREGLDKIESALMCANEVTVADGSLIEIICDISDTPGYNSNAITMHGLPRYLDPDPDGDAFALMPSSAQWQVGFALKDDDEDGDGKIDLKRRVYLSGSKLLMDYSVDEQAWGSHVTTLMTDVSTFTISYFGNKQNLLGKNIDLNGDGIISASEMDAAVPPQGQGNDDGVLDTSGERSYITQLHITVGWSPNGQGAAVYEGETDVYPPLLPLKPDSI